MSRKIPLDQWGNPIEYDRHERSVFHTGPEHPQYSFVNGYPVARTTPLIESASQPISDESDAD